uniref:hypothetical protein n=1 Tax=Citrobacter gillenii TaxID=67828 RepID=UPI0022E78D89
PATGSFARNLIYSTKPEFNISDALLNDIATDNPELAASMRENIASIRAEANDDSLGKAFRAFAACMINQGL